MKKIETNEQREARYARLAEQYDAENIDQDIILPEGNTHYKDMKDCPFCGGRARFERRSKMPYQGETRYCCYVHCRDCNSRGERFLLPSDENDAEGRKFARVSAIKAWNRRADKMAEKENEN